MHKSALFEPVSSIKYKLACALIEDSRSASASMQSDQSLIGALWVGKGPTFIQEEN